MDNSGKQRLDNDRAIFMMWLNWVVGFGALSAGVVLSKAVPFQWYPLVLFTIELFLYFQVRANREASLPMCMLTPFVITRVLLWSAAVCLLLGLMSKYGIYDSLFEVYWPEVPYIPIMVISPVAVVITGWALKSRHSFPFCTDCRMRHGTPAERGFLGRLFSQEGWFQTRFLFWLSVVMTVTSYTYYFSLYINAGLSSSDRFFFLWLPVIFYGVSVVYMGLRYFNLWAYYSHNIVGPEVGMGASSVMRYLVINGERILLTAQAETLGEPTTDTRYDTPATLTLFHRERIPLDEARRYFQNLSDIKHFGIRFMYRSGTADGLSNMFHFIVSIDNIQESGTGRLNGEWIDMYRLEKLLNSDRLRPILAAEIYRLHAVTMAWKTYDRDGRRRYKIKNYRPNFKLRDIVNWDVDFNDPQWLYVSVNNQDSRFYRIKRLWRRYINGIKE